MKRIMCFLIAVALAGITGCATGGMGKATAFDEATVAIEKIFVSGGNRSLALDEKGDLWVWGYNVEHLLDPEVNGPRQEAVKIAEGVIDAACSDHAIFIIKEDKSLWILGDIYTGMGDVEDVEYTDWHLLDRDVADVAVKSLTTAYVKTDGTAWGLGHNPDQWQLLGIGPQEKSIYGFGYADPIQMKTENGFIENAREVRVGYDSLQILDKDGRIWASGYLHHILGGMADRGEYFIPGPDNVKTLSKGIPLHAAAITEEGKAMVQFFDFANKGNDQEISFIMDDLAMLASLYYHTIFLDSEGLVYVAGYNAGYCLGLAKDGERYSAPVELTFKDEGEELKITDVCTAANFSLFLDEKGRVWGCGENEYGQLGLGTELKGYMKSPRLLHF